MRGHEPLLAMRRSGVRPKHGIYIDATNKGDWWKHWAKECLSTAFIEVEPGDDVGRLDFRCCFGMPVDIVANDEQRAQEIATAVAVAGGSIVSAGWGGMVGEEFRIEQLLIGTEEISKWLKR